MFALRSEELVEVPWMVTPVSVDGDVQQQVNSVVNNCGVMSVCVAIDVVGDPVGCALSGKLGLECALKTEVICVVPRASVANTANVASASGLSSLSDVKWMSDDDVKPARQLCGVNADYSCLKKNQLECLEEIREDTHQVTENIPRDDADYCTSNNLLSAWETDCEEVEDN